jgi:PAS domain S-box-containing protein
MAKILAIDDNIDHLTVLSALLAKAFPAIEFIHSFSGEKGIDLCISERPDVILLDINLSKIDGFEVCRILKLNEATNTIPVIMITAVQTDKDSRIKALEAGADAFLAKPVDESELTAQIKAMLRIKEAEDRKLDENERLKSLVENRTQALQKELKDRKLAENALKKSEERLKQVVDCSGTWIWEVDCNGIYTYVSEFTETILGYKPEEIIGQRYFFDFFEPGIKENLKNAAFEVFSRKGTFTNFENTNVHKDGHTVVIETTGIPLLDQSGNLLGYRGADKDITNRKITEETIKKSETQFREFFEKAADAIFIAEIESGIIVDVNEAGSRMMQVAREQIIGRHHSQIHPGTKEEFSKETFKGHDQLVKQNLPTTPTENEVIRPDGSLIPVEIMASEVIYKNKKCLMGTFRDISERKQADMKLRESEYFFKESQRAAFVGSYKFDMIADTWTSSEVLEQIFGIDKNFNRNLKGWLDITHPDDREMMKKYFLEEVIGKRQPFIKEYRIISKLEAETRWVLGLGKLNFDAEGNIIEMIGTIQDISERKLVEQARNETYEFIQSLLKTIPFGMDIVDEEGNILFQSANLENIYTSRAMGRKCWDLYRDDHTKCNVCPLKDGIKLGKTGTCEITNILGGRVFEINHTGMMFRGKKAMLEIFQDITDRKNSEENLRESQELFQELFNASPDAIVLIDPNHATISWPIVDCNNACCRMNGYTREEMIGNSIDLLNINAGTIEERITYLEFLRTEGVFHSETVHRHKDGHVFSIEVLTSIITIGGRELVLGIDRDITERKMTEEAIRVNEIRLKRAELASKSGNWEFYLDSQIMVGSEGAVEVYGLDGDKFEYDVIKNVPLPTYRPVLDEAFKNLVENDIPYDIEFKIKTVNTQKIKDIHSVAFFNKERRVMFGVIQDITERKQAEMELLKSEDRYRSFISQISEGVYRFECDEPIDINLPIEEQIDLIYNQMRIAECNKAFLDMYGMYDEKEVIGKTQLDFHGSNDNPLNRKTLRDFVSSGYRVENAITHENGYHGHVVYFSNNALGIIENNHLVRIWGTQADISEKTRADQIQQLLYTISNAAYSSIDLPELIKKISEELGKLLDSTNFYIAFYDEKTDMLSTIYETDEKDEISTWPAAKSITGYVIKNRKSMLVNENDVRRLCQSGEIEIFGTPSKVWLGVPLFTDNKVAGALVVQSYDNPNAFTEKDLQILEFISHQISVSIERKKTDQDLKLMGKAFIQSPVTIVITDKMGNIEYTNPKFSESTGYTLDEVKGKNPRVLQSGNQSKEYYKELWNTILEGKDWFGEFQNKRKNGESFWESAVISPITNELGEIAFFLAIKEDITEKKKMIEDLIHARKKAEESDRLKSAFLANMSHEIRTPLNAIIGFSELIRDPAFEPEQQDEFAQLINDSGNNLLSILSDIMDISKIEAGQVAVIKRKVSINKLINSIQKEFVRKTNKKGIEFRIFHRDPLNPVEIETDETKIRQIIVNFLGNAIKFTEKGFIELGIEPEENFVRLYVKDTGIGIPESYHEKIFERFRQVETSHTRKYGGNGLGLCISKNLIELLGGTIGMESEEGKGSTFFITIPKC